MTSVFGGQILGRRENQEDGFRIELQNDADPGSDILMVLADGMGGHAAGEVASRVALDAFMAHFLADGATRPLDRLEASLRKANEAIAAQVARAPELAGMGCTLIGCLKLNDGLAWVSVGDSLLVRVRAGELQRLNADHSVYGELIDLARQGRLPVEEAERHPQRHALRSAVIGTDMPLVDLGQADFAAGDVVLLASDGIETLDGEQIVRVLDELRDAGAEAICERLLAAVEGANRPNQDNTTVIALRVPGVAQEARPAAASFSGGARDPLGAAKRLASNRPLAAAVGGVAVLLLLLATLWPTDEPPAAPVRQAVTEQPRTGTAPVPTDDGAMMPAAAPKGEPQEGEVPPDRATPPAKAAETKAATPPARAGARGDDMGSAAGTTSPGEKEETKPVSEAGSGPGAQGASTGEPGSRDMPVSRSGPK